MANFATHIGVGTVVSGAMATLTLAADVISPESLVAVTLAGVLGSVLPDVDLKDSRPSRFIFSGLAVFLSFCVLFSSASKYSIAELWIIWLGTFALVRYGGEAGFHRFSYHRGIWHSVLAGLFFWFLTAVIFKYALGRHEGVAWLAGGFLFVGYMTHLVLDELYSVDLMDRRLKLSFGSALKLYDGKNLGDSAIVAAAAALVFMLAPPSAPFVDGITSPQLWSGLQRRLLPADRWFAEFTDPVLKGVRPTSAEPSPVTTGSIPPAIRPATPPAPADAREATPGPAR